MSAVQRGHSKGNYSARVVAEGWQGEILGYLLHCRALLLPGTKVPVFCNPRMPDAIPESATGPELDLLIAEASSQLDRQKTGLAEIRSRALGMTTVALTELGLLAATAQRFTVAGGWPLILWVGCFLLVVAGLAGMGSVASSRADFGGIDISRLLGKTGELHRVYANELVDCIPLGDETLNARVTVFRDALLLMALGAVFYGILWIVMLGR